MIEVILNLPWHQVLWVLAKGLAAGCGVGIVIVVSDWIRLKRRGEVL